MKFVLFVTIHPAYLSSNNINKTSQLPLTVNRLSFVHYRCENPRCIGNPKAKEVSSLQPPTIASVLGDRLDYFIRSSTATTAKHNQSDYVTTALKTMLKPQMSTQKSLEALNGEMKKLLRREVASLLPPEGQEEVVDAEKGEDPIASIPISNEYARLFLLALLSYHPEKKIDEHTNLTVTVMKGQPCILVNNDRTSFQKCLVALQREYLE